MSDIPDEEATYFVSPIKKNPHGKVSKNNFIVIFLFNSENYDKIYIKML